MKKVLFDIYYGLMRAQAKLAYKKSIKHPVGYDRMYHVHIRKSAGTSVNAAFWSKAGYSLSKVRRRICLIGKGFVLARNNVQAVNNGCYFYANSHNPVWSISIPNNTFTFCILRDPYNRLVSLYRYYRWVLELDPDLGMKQEPYYKNLLREAECAKAGFEDFLLKVPKRELANQLFMFSESFNPDEAIRMCNNLTRVYFLDHFEDMILDLSKVAGFPLENRRERRSSPKEKLTISASQKQHALELLKDEYMFYNAMRKKILDS